MSNRANFFLLLLLIFLVNSTYTSNDGQSPREVTDNEKDMSNTTTKTADTTSKSYPGKQFKRETPPCIPLVTPTDPLVFSPLLDGIASKVLSLSYNCVAPISNPLYIPPTLQHDNSCQINSDNLFLSLCMVSATNALYFVEDELKQKLNEVIKNWDGELSKVVPRFFETFLLPSLTGLLYQKFLLFSILKQSALFMDLKGTDFKIKNLKDKGARKLGHLEIRASIDFLLKELLEFSAELYKKNFERREKDVSIFAEACFSCVIASQSEFISLHKELLETQNMNNLVQRLEELNTNIISASYVSAYSLVSVLEKFQAAVSSESSSALIMSKYIKEVKGNFDQLSYGTNVSLNGTDRSNKESLNIKYKTLVLKREIINSYLDYWGLSDLENFPKKLMNLHKELSSFNSLFENLPNLLGFLQELVYKDCISYQQRKNTRTARCRSNRPAPKKTTGTYQPAPFVEPKEYIPKKTEAPVSIFPEKKDIECSFLDTTIGKESLLTKEEKKRIKKQAAAIRLAALPAHSEVVDPEVEKEKERDLSEFTFMLKPQNRSFLKNDIDYTRLSNPEARQVYEKNMISGICELKLSKKKKFSWFFQPELIIHGKQMKTLCSIYRRETGTKAEKAKALLNYIHGRLAEIGQNEFSSTKNRKTNKFKSTTAMQGQHRPHANDKYDIGRSRSYLIASYLEPGFFVEI